MAAFFHRRWSRISRGKTPPAVSHAKWSTALSRDLGERSSDREPLALWPNDTQAPSRRKTWPMSRRSPWTCEPFFSALKDVVSSAEHKVVFDRFHIIGHMNQALDQVRRAENKALRAEGDDRLVGSKQWWLYAAENVPEHRHDELWSLRHQMNLRTARAWDEGTAAWSVGLPLVQPGPVVVERWKPLAIAASPTSEPPSSSDVAD